jgi:DNA-binding NarL/FixJ family response regulator
LENLSKQTKKSSAKQKTIRILIADDHKMFRQGLMRMLDDQGDITVVGEAKTGREAIRLSAELAPDIILMDISLPDIDGIAATKRILDKAPTARVIALSMHSAQDFIQNMMRSGARGYLTKDCEFKELLRAVHSVYQGQSYLCPGVAGVVIESYVRRNNNSAGSHLTDRERDVLRYVAEGLSTKKIAANMNVSTKTVETHRRQIMRKLDIFSVPQLTKYAIRQGLSSLEI